jgi:tetratricopeptide (TPR) repeat protein
MMHDSWFDSTRHPNRHPGVLPALVLFGLSLTCVVRGTPVIEESGSADLALAFKAIDRADSKVCLELAAPHAASDAAPAQWRGIMAVCSALEGNSAQANAWLGKTPAGSGFPFAATVRALLAAQVDSWPQVETEAKQALAASPDNAVALMLLGRVELMKKADEAAITYFNKAVAIAPDNAPAQTALGGALLAKNKTAEASEHFLKALSVRPNELAARLGLGIIYQSLGLMELAEKSFELAVAINPKSAPAALGLAEIRLFNGNPKSALSLLEPLANAKAKGGSDGKIRMLMGESRFRLGRFQEAAADFRAGDPGGHDPVALHWIAVCNLASKDYPKALAAIDAALKSAPESASYRLMRGIILSQSGKPAEAHSDFTLAGKRPALAPLTAFCEAQLFLSEGNFKLAMEALARSTEALPGFIIGNVDWSKQVSAAQVDGSLDVQRGMILLRNQQGSQVHADLAKRKDNLLAAYLSAKAFRLTSDPAKSATEFGACLRLDPGFIPAYLELAKLHTDAKEYAKALERYRALESLDPRGQWVASLQLQTFMGSLYERMGSPGPAMERYEKALLSAPDNAYVHNQLGWLLGKQKEYVKAIAHLEKAVKAEPRAFAYIDNLGWIKYLNKDYPEALKSLEAAQAIGIQDPALEYHLGMVQFKLKNLPEAKRHLGRALAMRTDFPGAEEAKATLRSI